MITMTATSIVTVTESNRICAELNVSFSETIGHRLISDGERRLENNNHYISYFDTFFQAAEWMNNKMQKIVKACIQWRAVNDTLKREVGINVKKEEKIEF